MTCERCNRVDKGPWFLLMGGLSPDKSPAGTLESRTFDPKLALNHYRASKSAPYSVGGVVVIHTDRMSMALKEQDITGGEQ